MSVLPILSTSPFLGAATQLISFTYAPPAPGEPETGFNPGRQEGSHPHQILPVPALREVLVPDLGSDKVWRLQKQGDKYVVAGFVPFPIGSGPRHALFLGACDSVWIRMGMKYGLT